VLCSPAAAVSSLHAHPVHVPKDPCTAKVYVTFLPMSQHGTLSPASRSLRTLGMQGEENEWARSLPVSAIGRAIDAQMGCSVEAAALQVPETG